MNIQELEAQLKTDEGYRLEVYKDSRGFDTVGIGHLVTKEDDLNFGDSITNEQVDTLFQQDLSVALSECQHFVSDFDTLPEKAQQVIANLMFNMGLHKLSQFVHFKAAIEQRNWAEAGNQLIHSVAYAQEKNRIDRLVTKLNSIV